VQRSSNSLGARASEETKLEVKATLESKVLPQLREEIAELKVTLGE
jgi:hypothetical protein